MDEGGELAWGPWGPPVRVLIERSAVWTFARAVKDENPVYASSVAAAAAGFAAVPCPPTFTFVMRDSGAYPDLQPAGAGAGGGARGGAGSRDVSYNDRPGLSLHGEQSFTYHRTPLVGDVLDGRMRVSTPVVRARSGGRGRMEVTYYETEWRAVPDGAPVVSERITALFLPD